MRAFTLFKLVPTIVLCIDLAAFSGCRDRKNEEQPALCTAENTIPFPEDALDRFYFKTGTYWVYKELSTGNQDTIRVKETIKNTDPVNEKVFGEYKTEKCYELYTMTIQSDLYGKYLRHLELLLPYDGFDYDKESFRITEIWAQEFSYKADITGNVYRELNGDGNSVTLLDSLVTPDTTYKNVLFIKKKDGHWDYLDEAWYVKGPGLVKYKRKDGTEWELVKSEIIQ